MEKIDISNVPSIIFNNATEYRGLSQDPNEVNVPLTNKIDFAISDEAAEEDYEC